MKSETKSSPLTMKEKRRTIYDKRLIKKIVKEIEEDMPRSEAIATYGMCRKTLSNWLVTYASPAYLSKNNRRARKDSEMRYCRRAFKNRHQKKVWCQAVIKMKQDFPLQGIKSLCRLFGKTRHAYYDRQWRITDQGLKDEIVLQNVLKIRKELPRLGTVKLHMKLKDVLESHEIKIGRDYLFDLMRDHNLQIRTRKRNTVTTDSRHWMHKYVNLVRELDVHRPEQLWVSDITYIRLRDKWGYLSLITDAYSRQIMGFCFRTDLSAKGCVDALEMALKDRLYPNSVLIHHSDRGSQYCSKAYVDILMGEKMAINMTENGDPYENALAERVNRTIKSEFELYSSRKGLRETTNKIRASIKSYNESRPHSSIDFLTPEQAHQCSGPLKKHWKSKTERRVNNCV